ncbi:MAG: hypothetical protein KBF99_15345 [Leptospiraceae bacterium]|nr:hypothetical protein [Leptospiraceae bacterium]
MKGKILFSILIFTLGFQGLIADDKEDKCASFQKKDTCSKYREKRSPKKQACQWRVDRRILPFGGECLNVSEYKKKVKEEAEAAKKAEEEKTFCDAFSKSEDCNKTDQKFACGWLTHLKKPTEGRCIVKHELDRILRAEDPSDRRPKSQEAIQMSREDYFRTFE